ncbi:MAG: hypothetical protein U1E73_11985 [Planctomycetota bacterium]
MNATAVTASPGASGPRPGRRDRSRGRSGRALLQLTIVGSDGRDVFQTWVQDGWRFPISALPGDYRVEVRDRHGKLTARSVHLGLDGVDLSVP